MISQAFKRLWNDKRGNALMIAGAAMPLIFGSVGLATDTVQWTLWKRQLQRSADSAAYSGVYARFQDASATSAATSVVTKDLANANLTSALLSGYPVVTQPTDTTAYTKTVQVRIDVQRALTFSSMFMSAAPVISVTARAAAIDSGTFCLVALKKGATSGITISGSAIANLGCGAIANANSASDSIGVNGNKYTFIAIPVASVGGLPSTSLTGHGSTNLQPFHLAQPDPYESKHSTVVPDGMTCRTDIAAGTVGGVVQPGCFNSFSPANGTTNLAPGVYYLNSTNLSISGNITISGTGVTLIFTGATPGSLTMNGNAVINLTAPTSGAYAKMLMIQSANAVEGNVNKINGNSGANFDGTMYFPKGHLNFTGSASTASKCMMVVASTVEFGGNSAIQNNTAGCTASSTVSGKVIRLIA